MGQITLPGKLNFQTTAHNLAFQTALQKIVYPPNIPSAYRYPKAPYGVGRLGAHGDTPGPPYCTDFPDYASMLQYFGVQACTQSDPASQFACSQTNVQPLINVANFQNNCSYPPVYQSGYVPVNPANPQGTTNTGGSTYAGTTPTQSSGGGSLMFSTSRGGSVLQPGDTYTLRVLGPPNTPVTATVTFNGSTSTSSQGSTGADGSFVTTGGISSSEIGSWSQTWSVGSQSAGTINFTVVGAGSAPPPANAPTGSIAPPATGTTQGSYSPTVTFIPSRQGVLQVGDSWVIRVMGGQPNAIVSVSGGQNGQSTINQMGTTDQNGNFQLSGTIDASSVGSWAETWYVGNQAAGSFSFSVAAPSSGSGGNSPLPGGSSSNTGSSGNSGSSSNNGSSGTSSTTWIPGVSNTTVLAGGGGLLLLVLLMGGKR